MSPMHQRTTRLDHTNSEEWYDIEELIPGIREYVEQTTFNITMFSKYHGTIKKTHTNNQKNRSTTYIKYNINGNGSVKLFTIYLAYLDNNRVFLRFWETKNQKDRRETYPIENLDDLKKMVDEWFEKFLKYNKVV